MVAFSVNGDISQIYVWDEGKGLLYHSTSQTGVNVRNGGGVYFSMDSATFAKVSAHNTIIP